MRGYYETSDQAYRENRKAGKARFQALLDRERKAKAAEKPYSTWEKFGLIVFATLRKLGVK